MSTLAAYASGFSQWLGRTDKVVLAIFTLAIGVAALLPPRVAVESYRFTTLSMINIAPFLAASAVAAAWLAASGADRVIGRVFSGHWLVVIVSASVFGALSPFCSCGVIPIIAALLAAGVPLPAVMAFWLSSPIMDPEMFLLTLGGLNLEFAIAKTLAAFAIGLFGGFATHLVLKTGGFADPLKEQISSCGSCQPVIGDEKPLWIFWKEPARKQKFTEIFKWTMLFLGKWLLLAFAIESLMVTYLPGDVIAGWLGPDSTFAMPLAVVIGIPAYMNGYAAIPLISGLLQSGMAEGPALAFMTAGAVTSIPAAVAVFALVKRPVFLWYLALAAVGSMITGTAFQFYLSLA
ncbi:MAG: permease [Rhodospirillaceae bacterium]|nr:permease [Rhodospirillaceae bacterium]